MPVPCMGCRVVFWERLKGGAFWQPYWFRAGVKHQYGDVVALSAAQGVV